MAVPPRRAVWAIFLGLQVLLRRPGFGLTMSAPAPSGNESPPPARGSTQFAPPPANYMSVKDAILEQAEQRRQHRMNQPQTVRLPPAWAEVHMKAAQQQSMHGPRSGPPPKVGFPRPEDGLMQPSAAFTASNTSSVAMDGAPPGSPSGHAGTYGVRSALGGSSKSGLNHTSTYFYGEAPLKPVLCTGNMYNAVGSYSMFGSQALSERN